MFTIMCLVIYGIVMTLLLARSNQSTKKWIEKHQYAAKERDMTNDRAEALSSRLTAAEATLSSVLTVYDQHCQDPRQKPECFGYGGRKPERVSETPALALLAIKTTLVEQNTTIKSLLAGIASNLERTGGYDQGATIESQINALGDRWEAERSEKIRLQQEVLDFKEREDYYEHQSDKHQSAMSELRSNIETWKNLANTYLLSRNQARDDIQSMKLILVDSGIVESQLGLDTVCKYHGVPCPQDVRDAQTFDQFRKIAKERGILAFIEASKGEPLGERLATPPKPRRTRGRK